MSNQISWLVELAVKLGQIDNFRALTGEMVESTREEPGVLSYERFVTDDAKFVHVYERLRRLRRGAGALTRVPEEIRRPVLEHGGTHGVQGVRQPN